MRERGGGSILSVTASSIKEPIDILLLSNVFRSGVASLMKSLSKELAPDRIRVNNLVPGRIDTDRVRSLDEYTAKQRSTTVAAVKAQSEASIPLGRYGTIQDFGKAATFLLSDAAGYVTGETFIVDGGTMHTVW
jgi:3-oxoacyl-[acyl-carrier protein] reductase